jgi:TolB-like protein/Tfp pilus assembly protein PilF
MLAPAPTMPSIAVLPFADLSPEKDQEYFADGLAEELLNVLSKINGLRVASRTSAFSFKGLNVDIPTVGQKLNVASVLEGSVRTSGKRVRITTQLIQVATDSQLWSQTYDRELEDIFAAQDNIAQSVVNELRAELLGEKLDARASAAVKAEVQAAAKGRGDSADAYRLYLQGRFFENRFTREDTANAIAYYRQALDIDPDYALAWAGISRAYSDQAGFSWNSVAEGFQKAREAAEAALRLEPDLAEGHHALGVVHMLNDWDWKAADASFRRAVELSPNDAQLMRDAGVLAGNLGRAEEAVGLLQRAVVFDPLSVQTYRSLGRMCFFADRLEEAEAAISKALELNPHGELSHWSLGLVRLAQGQPDEALQMFLREGHEIFRLLGLAMAKHALGRPQESDETLGELIKKYGADAAYQIALGYAFRAEIDLAFEWLERAYAERDPGLSHAKVTPLLKNLRANAQWQPFLKKLGLAD